tara:strand:- start:3291 stop:3572 length:282 start_codon:yes stop_codon:yes gene_type:complete
MVFYAPKVFLSTGASSVVPEPLVKMVEDLPAAASLRFDSFFLAEATSTEVSTVGGRGGGGGACIFGALKHIIYILIVKYVYSLMYLDQNTLIF